MRVCLVEDGADNFEPLTLTRPVFDLLCGMTSLGHKQLRHFGATEYGVWVRPGLRAVAAIPHPNTPVNDSAWLHAGDTILVNGRWLPPAGKSSLPRRPCVGMVDGEVAFAVLRRDQLAEMEFPPDLATMQIDAAATMTAAPGRLLRYPWDLVEANTEQLRRDVASRSWERSDTGAIALIGSEADLYVDSTARIDPYVVADTTAGPVVIDRHAVVTAFTRLEGPCYIGAGTQVHGGKIRAGSTLGPECRIGGEVEASIIQGHTNKVHDGFLGHSYIGEWVNLGAGTHNSDLRNDYGEVSVIVRGERVPTGLTKVGCFIGDHTKTGLSTLLNTGTSIGAFCNLLPTGRFMPKYVPSCMTYWDGRLVEQDNAEQRMETARKVMQRRGVNLVQAHIDLYAALESETAAERRRILREAEPGTLRRSA